MYEACIYERILGICVTFKNNNLKILDKNKFPSYVFL